MESAADFTKFMAAMLAIVNPLGAVPVFINLTGSQGRGERHRTGFIAAAAVAVILWVALLTGESVLRFFGISMASFRVGGGILILIMSISMLHARLSPTRQTEEEAEDSAERDSVAVVPLGMPLLAGPGAISTVILYGQRLTSPAARLLLAAEIAVVAGTVWASFRAAPYLAVALGKTGINIVTRIMGLIIAAIGVEFIAMGLRELFPALG